MRFIAFATVVGLAACSGESSGGPIALADFPNALAGAYCEYARHCVSQENDAPESQRYLSASSTCASDFLRLAPSLRMPRLLEAVQDGTVGYDANKARACVDSLAASCNVVFDLGVFGSGPCAETFLGTVDTNGRCHTDAECTGDRYCNLALEACPGTCVRKFQPGLECHSNVECSAGTGLLGECLADSGAATFHCVAVVLAPDAAEGAACGDQAVENTVVRTACAAGLFCPNGGGTCRAPHAVGESCIVETDYACADGALCLGAPGSATCRATTVVDAVGEACDDIADDHASYRLCNPLHGLVCSSGACSRSGSGAEGSHCTSGGLLISCNAGLVCNSSTTSCVAPVGLGETCYSDIECESGACDQAGTGATHTCVEGGCGG